MNKAVVAIKEVGGIVLLPSPTAFEVFLKKIGANQNPREYTRTYLDGIRVMYGNFNWKDYENHLRSEKIVLDSPDDTDIFKELLIDHIKRDSNKTL